MEIAGRAYPSVSLGPGRLLLPTIRQSNVDTCKESGLVLHLVRRTFCSLSQDILKLSMREN